MIENTLAGLRVVDLTQNVAGPFCTQILGDLGAEVIKIERPGQGDDTRGWRPPEISGQSSTFLALNRNKSSVCIDIDAPDGLALLRQLTDTADIFVHSMKPGSAEKRGLGFEDLEARNPGLIFCEISAFGQVGPLAKLPGYDPLMQAFTGIMSTTGHEGDDPVRVGISAIDMGAGMWAALGILAAVIARAGSGRGARVSTSLLETGLSWMTIFVASYLATGVLPRRMGSAMAMTAPYELFASADGQVFVAAGNDRLFANVCRGLDLPDLPGDPAFATNRDRVLNRTALHRRIEARTRTMKSSAIVAALRLAGAPCSELNDVAQMLDHEQVKATSLVRTLPVDGAPGHRVILSPVRMAGDPSSRLASPPALGRDTAKVMVELGQTPGGIDALMRAGVIG